MKKFSFVLFVWVAFLTVPLFAFAQTTVKGIVKEGIVQLWVEDAQLRYDGKEWSFPENGRANYTVRLRTADGNFLELDRGKINLEKFINRKVEVTGEMKEFLPNRNRIMTVSSIKVLDQPTSSDFQPTVGNYKVMVVVVTVVPPSTGRAQASPSSFTLEEAKAPVFTSAMSAKQFFLEASKYSYTGQQLKLVGLEDVEGGDAAAVTIISPVDDCDNRKFSQWPALIDNALVLQGKTPQAYNSIIHVYDQDQTPGCSNPLGGFGTVGSLGNMTQRQYIFTSIQAFDLRGTFVVSHEIGHNLGASHSSSYNGCTDINEPTTCVVHEYGSYTDVMGSFYRLPSLYNRHRWGWHHTPFKELAMSGNYSFYSPSLPSNQGGKRLFDAKFSFTTLSSGSWAGNNLYLESRGNSGRFDDNSEFPLLTQGVTLIVGATNFNAVDQRSYTLDLGPEFGGEDASLRLASVTLNGILITHHRDTTAVRGSGVNITFP